MTPKEIAYHWANGDATMSEIEQIKLDHFEAVKGRRVILIVEADYGFQVEQWTAQDVAPTSYYDTAQEAAARVLQLLNLTEPVMPQDWPEMAQIGGPPSPPPPPLAGEINRPRKR